jgi:flagellar motor protein MotB
VAGESYQIRYKPSYLATRLKSKDFGATQPVAPNTTNEGKELNRRVELNVL